MAVRAKFKVVRTEGFVRGDEKVPTRVEMQPVYSGSEENRQFFSATPGGRIELNILNENAGKYFDDGAEYYVDFTKAE